MKIAIIGKGNVGGNLGARLEKSGFSVTYGTKENAAEAAKQGDVVFLAVPGSVAVEVARSLAKQLEGKVVVDCNNAVTWKEGPVWNPPPEGSLTAAIAKAAPGARVLKAFNGFGAEHHADPNLTGAPASVFMAGDDADAKKTLSEIATKAGFAPVDAGPLRNAAVLENVAILWIHMAMVGGHGRNWVLQARGLK
jgi:hypothetical protein